jgi:hypothetical protein
MMRATGFWESIAIAAMSVTSIAATPASSPAAPDPETIFANVRQAWSAGAYPRYGSYATIVEFHTETQHIKRTWDTIEDFRHAVVFSRKFSREEVASPPDAPRGINIAVPFFGTLNKVQEVDPVGHVAFAVDQDYGIAPADRRYTPAVSAADFAAVGKTLPIIGRTGVKVRDYDVRLIETLDDERGREYHLGLTPLRNPAKYRLRELWVDAKTWLPEEAIVSGIGSRPPLTTVPWRIEYRQAEGGTYIARETALADVDYGAAGMLHWLTVSFEELAPSASGTGLKYAFGISDDKPQTDP